MYVYQNLTTNQRIPSSLGLGLLDDECVDARPLRAVHHQEVGPREKLGTNLIAQWGLD